jgi:hypothetical protein
MGLALMVSVVLNICFLIALVCMGSQEEAMPPYDPEKTCAKGWHVFKKWDNGVFIQTRVCKRCGIKDTRIP